MNGRKENFYTYMTSPQFSCPEERNSDSKMYYRPIGSRPLSRGYVEDRKIPKINFTVSWPIRYKLLHFTSLIVSLRTFTNRLPYIIYACRRLGQQWQRAIPPVPYFSSTSVKLICAIYIPWGRKKEPLFVNFYPRDAASAGISCRRVSVCLSHVGIVSKRLRGSNS